ncbi:MAG: glycerophosphodiester phosphodiesterase [Gammaproteobacteria bacterium]|jgi:glycerophosphoryl diester phosphodiesterase|nr:glycerophosphodiester phosphodiesterase [Gammaproteobacteria bacterium]
MLAVIAHRGASGYLPEHTLPAKAMAYAMGADFLEQDVVATRDDELVVLHDIHLDRVTDVAARYPGRARADGRYYVRDFDVAEIRTLSVTERLDEDGQPVYPGRFPPHSGRFAVHTLAEELVLVAGLNRATGGNTGVYPEIKRPAWHLEQGIDITAAMTEVLAAHGYTGPEDAIFVQCFDAGELVRVRHELGCQVRLVQLIGENSWGESDTDYEYLRTESGLAELARSVDAIGPWVNQLYTAGTADGLPRSSGLTERAHNAGLLVHPYTFRSDDLAPGFGSFEEMVRYFCVDLAVDGLFTDFPDRVLQLLNDRADGR